MRHPPSESMSTPNSPLLISSKGQQVKPAFVGICGTDLHEYLAGPMLTPTKPHPLTHECNPVTLGHEFSGEVTEVGESVADIKVGDRVVVLPILYDGTCDACMRGYVNCCAKFGAFGFTGECEERMWTWMIVGRLV